MSSEHATPSSSADQMALARLVSEYLEMPGLRLTLAQAQRLMGLGEAECGRTLDALVQSGFLFRSTDGLYGRLGDGPIPVLSIPGTRPMAKAHGGRKGKSSAA